MEDKIIKLCSINKPQSEIKESHVKDRVKKIIAIVDSTADLFMSVQNGFGKSHLDFLISIKGFSFYIETKIVGKKPTVRQENIIAKSILAEIPVLIIDQENLIDVFYVADNLRGRSRCSARTIAQHSRELYYERAIAGNYKS